MVQPSSMAGVMNGAIGSHGTGLLEQAGGLFTAAVIRVDRQAAAAGVQQQADAQAAQAFRGPGRIGPRQWAWAGSCCRAGPGGRAPTSSVRRRPPCVMGPAARPVNERVDGDAAQAGLEAEDAAPARGSAANRRCRCRCAAGRAPAAAAPAPALEPPGVRQVPGLRSWWKLDRPGGQHAVVRAWWFADHDRPASRGGRHGGHPPRPRQAGITAVPAGGVALGGDVFLDGDRHAVRATRGLAALPAGSLWLARQRYSALGPQQVGGADAGAPALDVVEHSRASPPLGTAALAVAQQVDQRMGHGWGTKMAVSRWSPRGPNDSGKSIA